ncbi:MAG TPA: hypothetical protein VLX61_00725 [Anaerolineales bacterium]|nr:hypothetical protein [Anaerolineales bacterium]
MPALVSGTGTNTVYLFSGWLDQDGGSRWLAHEMGQIWDINSSPIIPLYGGVGDQLNKAMGGSILSTHPCHWGNKTGPGNNNRFKGPNSYGNNSSADYLAESFALSIYPNNDDPVPDPAVGWVNDEIVYEYFSLLDPGPKQW